MRVVPTVEWLEFYSLPLLKTLFALVVVALLAAGGYAGWYLATPVAVGMLPVEFEIPPGTRFRSAALATPGANRAGQDVFELRRTPIQRSDSRRHVAAKAAGGMRLESVLRGLVNRARYRGASV